MPHKQLAFQCLYNVQRNANHDDKRRAAEAHVNFEYPLQNNRNHCQNRIADCADQRNSVYNSRNKFTRRLARADTVFWFEFPPPLCVLNIFRREWAYRGRVRPDMPDQCVSRWDMKFLRMVWDFNQKNHRKIAAMLQNAENIRVIHFTNYRQVERYLRTL